MDSGTSDAPSQEGRRNRDTISGEAWVDVRYGLKHAQNGSRVLLTLLAQKVVQACLECH